MDTQQLTTLADCLRHRPDPRCARGVRHRWDVLLTILAAGLLCRQCNCREIAQWARAHRKLLARYLPLFRGRVPSEKTLQRALALLDLDSFRDEIYAFIGADRQPPPPEPAAAGPRDASPAEPVAEQPWRGLALDGKNLRGASRGGRNVHLLTLAAHEDGAVLGRRNVGVKANELTVAPRLLAGRELAGEVVTGDAMFCHRALSQQVLDQGGHYLWAVKENQPTLLAAVMALFKLPRSGPHPLTFWAATQLGHAHGRTEVRRLVASAALNDYLGWPGLQQVVWRRCEVVGRAPEDHWYVTSLTHQQAGPEVLLRLCREHWQIENNVNRALDVVFGEDASTLRSGTAPEAMNVLRDAVCHLLHRVAGFRLTDQLRHFSFYPAEALELLGLRRL